MALFFKLSTKKSTTSSAPSSSSTHRDFAVDEQTFSTRRRTNVSLFEPAKDSLKLSDDPLAETIDYKGPDQPRFHEAQRAREYRNMLVSGSKAGKAMIVAPDQPPRKQLLPRETSVADVRAAWLEDDLSEEPHSLKAFRTAMNAKSIKKAAAYGVAYAVDELPITRRPLPGKKAPTLPAYNTAEYYSPPIVYNSSAEPRPVREGPLRRKARQGDFELPIELTGPNCKVPLVGNCVEFVTITPLLERGHRHIVTHVVSKKGVSMGACPVCCAFIQSLVVKYAPAVIVDGATGIIYASMPQRYHTISEGVPHAYYPREGTRIRHGNPDADFL